MSLSKPIQNALVSYLTNLYTNPLRTKSLTSCVIFASANFVSQCSEKSLDHRLLMANALFGLLFGGPVAHYYYKLLGYLVPNEASLPVFKKMFIDRLMFMPMYLTLYVYVIARLQGKNHDEAMKQLIDIVPSAIKKNLTYLTIFQLVNLTVVPPMFRVLTMNLVGFFAIISFSYMKRQKEQGKEPK